MRWPRRFESQFLMAKRLACNPAEDGSCLLSEHLSPLDESACNPKPKSWRQTGRIPFNLGPNDLANDTAQKRRAPRHPYCFFRRSVPWVTDSPETSAKGVAECNERQADAYSDGDSLYAIGYRQPLVATGILWLTSLSHTSPPQHRTTPRNSTVARSTAVRTCHWPRYPLVRSRAA